ncbi:LamG-like jellyroll fold domain-containing protein [Verrucomicrobiaceae bacterium 227]
MKHLSNLPPVYTLTSCLIIGTSALQAQVLLSEDFDTGDGGFIQEATGNTPIDSIYNATRGTWSMEGDDAGPATNTLSSPAISVSTTSGIQVTFAHRYSIETDWDGVGLQISVDGLPFTNVPKEAFSQNGYDNTAPLAGNHVLNQLDGFNGDSPGYGDDQFVTSIADIGGVGAGSSVVIRFVGAWDDAARGPSVPGWELTSVTVDTLPDSDSDGMPDSYEDLNGLNKNTDDSALDPDTDGSTNLNEYLQKTDPQDDDSDDDTLKDGVETGTGIFVDATDTGSNPLSTDSDGDTLLDNVETGTGIYVDANDTGTDPNKSDTDGDQFSDPLEILKGTNPNNASSKPTAKLIAWWPLDVDGTDASGNGFDGTVIGTLVPSPGANGNTNGSLEFDGSSSHIDVDFAQELNPESFTITLWANTQTTGNYISPITSRDDVDGGVSTHGYILYSDPNGNWNFWTGDGNAGWDQLQGPPVAVETWTHLAISYDAITNTKKIWINGEEAASEVVPPTGATQYSPNGTVEMENLHIGAGADTGSTFFFDGMIDDVALFDSPLFQSDIQAIMANGVGSFTGLANPFRILSIDLSPQVDQATITWASQPGAIYAVDRTSDLAAASAEGGTWIELSDSEESQGDISSFTDAIPAGSSKLFYRIRKVN